MDGRDKYDMVYGSMFDDTELKGEYVDGRPGDDLIRLTTHEIGLVASYTEAHGGFGHDEIHGTSLSDNVFGDPPNDKAYGGQDMIRGYGGADSLRGGWWYDQIWAGAGDDYVWGGDELAVGNPGDPDYGDRLYGESGRDNLFGMDGNDWLEGNPTVVEGDFCDGGNHYDICVNCPTHPNCEVF
jgi:Ca2+-binding RTX toxin-like protein